MSNGTCNSIPSEHSCSESRNYPQQQKCLSLRQVLLALKNQISWVSFGQCGAMMLESTSCSLMQKSTCSAPEDGGVISEDNCLATSQPQLWDNWVMEDSQLAGRKSSFSPSFPLPSSPQIHF